MDTDFFKYLTNKAEELKDGAIKAAGYVQDQAGPAYNKFKDVASKAGLYIQTEAEPAYLSLLNKLEATYKSIDEEYQLDEKKAMVVDFVRDNHLNDPDAAVQFCKENTRTCMQIAVYLGMMVTSGPLLAGAAKMVGLCTARSCSGPLDIVWQSSIGDAARERIFSTLQNSEMSNAGEQQKGYQGAKNKKFKNGEDFFIATGAKALEKIQEIKVEELKFAVGESFKKLASWSRGTKESTEEN